MGVGLCPIRRGKYFNYYTFFYLFVIFFLYSSNSSTSNRLFSDGGNFSPEEVDTFKKKLEKLANKIDSAEGFVMADLEGMEARRLEQATEIANKFEDR